MGLISAKRVAIDRLVTRCNLRMDDCGTYVGAR